MAPPAVAAAELLWRKWLVLAATLVAGAVVGASTWAILSSRSPSPAPLSQSTSTPDRSTRARDEPAPAKEKPEAAAVPLHSRWLPRRTRLLVSLQTSELAGREEFERAVSLADPVWRAIVGELVETFGLRMNTIRRLSWASVDLAAWPDPGVVVIEFKEGQDAGVFRTVGEQLDIELAGEPCRRLTRGGWPHPFAVLDPLRMVTGREELLRELAGRSEGDLESVPIGRLLKAASPDARVTILLDLVAAREAGWRLPTSLMDVWPAGRDAWHVVWEIPQGIGVWIHPGERIASEVGLTCEGETAAHSVHAALDELIPAAMDAVGAQLESLGERLQGGHIAAAAAEQYDVLLTQAIIALESTRREVADQTVWLRTDWGPDVSRLAAAALDSRPTIRAEWLAAALRADEATHRRLLSGLHGYERAEGRFPAGAGGGALLPPETRLSWIATMLPYYGYRDWHRELDFRYSWNKAENRPITERPLDPVINPALGPSSTEAGFPVTHYVGVAGVGADAANLEAGDARAGVFGFRRTVRLGDIRDGASNTIALLGVTERLGAWAAGGDATVRALTQPPYVNGPDGFGSGQPGGMLAGMADGSVRFLSKEIDPTVLEQLATVAGREDVSVAALELPEPHPSPRPLPDTSPREPADLAEKPEPAVEGEPEPAVTVPEPIVGAEPQLPKVDVQARLADPILEIHFPGVPLVDAVDLLAQMSTLRISFDLEGMAQLGVAVREPVTVELSDVTVREVLEAILSGQGLAYVVQDDHILVTSPERKRNALRPVDYRVSDLTGLNPSAVTRLAGLVERLVAPESWRQAGGRGTVETEQGTLKVVQTDAVHHQVLAFCEKLRSARGMPLQGFHDPGKFTLSTRLDAARPKLSRRVTANFRGPAPLVRILSDLEELSETEILVDWLALGAQGTSREVEGSLSARQQPLSEALDALLRPLGLAYRVLDADTLQVTTRKEVGARLELEFYPVAGLLTEGLTPRALMERIMDQLAGPTWLDAGGPGVLCFDEPSGCLIVLQSQPVQFELQSLLDQWAAEKKTEKAG